MAAGVSEDQINGLITSSKTLSRSFIRVVDKIEVCTDESSKWQPSFH